MCSRLVSSSSGVSSSRTGTQAQIQVAKKRDKVKTRSRFLINFSKVRLVQSNRLIVSYFGVFCPRRILAGSMAVVRQEGWIAFPKNATGTRKRVQPAITDCCRSTAHEALLHKRLSHPCALRSGHPWPQRFSGRRSSPPASKSAVPQPFTRGQLFARTFSPSDSRHPACHKALRPSLSTRVRLA